MKLLLSAYACEPDKGSEPEVGWRVLLAAAQRHDVWLLTRRNNAESIRRGLVGLGLDGAVTVVGVDLGESALAVKRAGRRLGLYWYYHRWQALAGETARKLHERVAFDVVHHVTLATYWTPSGVSDLGPPFVWGPVGGGTSVPWTLLPSLGLKGAGYETARWLVQRVWYQLNGASSLARRSTTTLVQNLETAQRLRLAEPHVLPNALSVKVPEDGFAARRSSDVVMVGRLIALKAPRLALLAMRDLEHPTARLILVGDGPETPRLRRLADRLQIAHKVVFRGAIARDDVFRQVAEGGVLLHPALHEESPLAVAEALSVGTPVVALDRAGPRQVAQYWPGVPFVGVRPSTPAKTASAMAAAIDSLLSDSRAPVSQPIAPIASFEDELLRVYEAASSQRE